MASYSTNEFKGGLKLDRNPTIFTDEQEAKYEAYGRLVARRAVQAVEEAARENQGSLSTESRSTGRMGSWCLRRGWMGRFEGQGSRQAWPRYTSYAPSSPCCLH